MKASDWEFANRAAIFGAILGMPFAFYLLDGQNATAVIANRLGPALHIGEEMTARVLFSLAALLLAVAALIRTWASSYLNARIVYAADVKSESLIADGPYRRVRNPLYFANLLLAIGLGSMMSRTGLVVAVTATLLFCYRLIFREEADLAGSQAAQSDNTGRRSRASGPLHGRASPPDLGNQAGRKESKRKRGTGAFLLPFCSLPSR